jgi:cell division protein FtsB
MEEARRGPCGSLRHPEMRKNGRITWLGAFVIALAVSLVWLWQRDLIGRYHEWHQREDALRAVRSEARQFAEDLEAARQRVRQLDRDPLEMEAAIRRIRRLVRPGETIYRIEDTSAAGDEISPEPAERNGQDRGAN